MIKKEGIGLKIDNYFSFYSISKIIFSATTGASAIAYIPALGGKFIPMYL